MGTLRVVESLEQIKTGIRFKEPKSGQHRTIALPGYAIEELRRLKLEQAEELLALGIRQGGDTLVCARADGKPHRPLSLTYEFARFMSRLGFAPESASMIFDIAMRHNYSPAACIRRSPRNGWVTHRSRSRLIYTATSPIRCRATQPLGLTRQCRSPKVALLARIGSNLGSKRFSGI